MRRGLVGGFVVCVVAALCLTIVEAEQPSPQPANSYVVQFSGPVLESWKTALVEAGAEIGDYVPPFSFRVRMTPPVAARVRRLGFVSSVNTVRADQKLAPRLRRNGSMPYVIRLERGAVPADVETALGLAGVQVLRRGSQLLIVADSSQIDRLADIDGVATLENFVPRIKHNEFGGGVIMGSAAANASGYDGSSQIIGIADTVLGMGRRPRTPLFRVARRVDLSTGPAFPISVSKPSSTTVRRMWIPGMARTSRPRRWAGAAAAASAAAPRPGRASSFRPSRTMRCRRCSAT